MGIKSYESPFDSEISKVRIDIQIARQEENLWDYIDLHNQLTVLEIKKNRWIDRNQQWMMKIPNPNGP